MTPVAVGLVIVFFLVVFSQFGGRIRAANAISWWLMALFLVLGAAAPEIYVPLISALGIQVVSNFIFAAISLFLMYQLLELNAINTFDRRRMRSGFSRLAAQQFLAHRGAGPGAAGGQPKVLVVLPCYNEQDAIPTQVAAIRRLAESAPMKIDYCFVDDASYDSSAALFRQLAPLNHASHMTNLGVAGALLTGFADALGADYVVQCDGDGQHPAAEIPRLVRAAEEHAADLVIGSRFVSTDNLQENRESTTALRRFGSELICWTLRVLWPGTRSTDPTSGFRVYSKRAMKCLMRAMPDEYPEPETIALARSSGLKTIEVPVVMEKRATGESSLTGLKSSLFMCKVMGALLGLRLRSLVSKAVT